MSPNLGVLILGNSVFEGVGTAFLILPVYILATLWFTDTTSRAWAFGAISGMGGIGAAAGPLIGGLIDRDQLAGRVRVPGARRRRDRAPEPEARRPAAGRPDAAVRRNRRAVLSAVGMFFVVFGILQAGTNNTLFFGFLAIGAAFLAGFFLYIRPRARGRRRCFRPGCSGTAPATSPW